MARSRDGQKERLWRRQLSEQERSGLSVRSFCQSRGIVEGSFYCWRRELQARDAAQRANAAHHTPAASAPVAPAFAAITVSGLESLGAMLELVLPSGICVRVPVGFDQRTLRELLAVLEPPAC
jgi:hypothetical protein